jgi:hypothetical protein
MHALLRDPEAARELGAQARHTALERFNIRRFVDDWNAAFAQATDIQDERCVA